MRKRMTVHGMLKEWQSVQVKPTPHFNQHSETTLATHSTGYPGHGGRKDLVPAFRASRLPSRRTDRRMTLKHGMLQRSKLISVGMEKGW